MTTTTTATAIDVERYVQLDALLNTLLLVDPELVPDVNLDDVQLVSHPAGDPDAGYSSGELFEAVIPAGAEDSVHAQLARARGMLLAARILRSATPEVIGKRAAELEASAARLLFLAHLDGVA